MRDDMRQSDDNRFIPMTTINAGKGREVRPDIYYYTNQIVNFVMVGDPSGTDWVLIDAGMPKSGHKILEVATERFSRNNNKGDRPCSRRLGSDGFQAFCNKG